MAVTRRHFLAYLMLMAGMLPAAARADDGGGDHSNEHDGEAEGDHDHDDARDAVGRGEIIPLHEALEIVDKAKRGHIIDMALTKNKNGYVYIFKLKAGSGRVTILRMDAKTGHVIDMIGS